MLYKDYVERKVSNAIRINSAEGYPCVFDNSKGRPLKDYKLYGKSIQDGTPNPDNPIEIQSVGDLTTKNLFNYADYTTLTKYNGDDISANWLTIDGDLFYIKYDYYNGGCWLTPTKQWELSSGTYTLSGKCKDNTIKGNPNICFCGVRWSDDTRNAGWGKPNSNDGEWYNFSYTFTITEDKTVKGVYLQDNGAQKKSAICFTNIQLEEGSTATEYEPYHKYDIPITVTGKNLIKYPYYHTTRTVNGVTWTDNGDGTITASGTPTDNTSFFLANRMSISTNTKYCFSGIDGTSNIMLNVTLYDENNTFVADLSNTNTSNSLAFDTTDYPSAIYARFLIKRKKNGVEVSGTIKPQLELGTTATEYEPYKGSETTHIYLDEPLRKVGSYADNIDFKHQKVVRNIVKCSLSVDSIYRKLNNVIRFGGMYWDIHQKGDYNMCSTIFRYIPSSWHHETESIFHHDGVFYIYYWSVYWHRLGLTYDGTNVYRTDDTEQTPLTDSEIVSIAKEWLKTLSDKDKEIYMIRSKSTKKSTTSTALKTFKGTNIISVDTTIQPSNAEITYYSNVKE